MAQYRKKPVVIEAWQYFGWDGEKTAAYPGWLIEAFGRSIMAHDDHLAIKTLEGTMRAEPKDWIIRGVKGKLYPCKPDIFEATYEAV